MSANKCLDLLDLLLLARRAAVESWNCFKQLGVWHELIVHVHWATDNSGVVEVWHRVKGQIAWTKTANLTGYPTLQVRPDGTYPTNTLDKNGACRVDRANVGLARRVQQVTVVRQLRFVPPLS